MTKRSCGRNRRGQRAPEWWRRYLCHGALLTLLVFFLVLSNGCAENDEGTNNRSVPLGEGQSPSPPSALVPTSPTGGCLSCHVMETDAAHAFACTACHQGKPAAGSVEEAHAGLTARPAHPENMARACGGCHVQVKEAEKTSHFALAGEINTVRTAFGARHRLSSLLEVPSVESPSTPLELADDLLRRRCLVCHLYSRGEPYEKTTHGTGCAACHLDFAAGRLESHRFLRRPGDAQCLSCHSGNFVGADYYGRFEADLNTDYRMPYQPDGKPPSRPYGVEYHQLAADVHQRAGMACIDCHSGADLMGGGHGGTTGGRDERAACLSCHGWRPGEPLPPGRTVKAAEERILLSTKHSGRELVVPALRHPAHDEGGGLVRCTVCHAQWTFYDRGTWLLRLDQKDYEPWAELVAQGNIEAELQLLDGPLGNRFEAPFMSDGVTGERRPGVWLKGFEVRRWEQVLTCLDEDGRLAVCRPVLDLHLSWVDAEGRVVFDGVRASSGDDPLRPYTPHTIGKAGAFWRARLQTSPPVSAKRW